MVRSRRDRCSDTCNAACNGGASVNVPSVTGIVAEFRHALREPTRSPRSGVLGLLLALHHNNVAQWDREDAARSNVGNDHAVAVAKQEIDALNAKRHELVEAIDAALAAGIEQSAEAPPTTESPAMVLDRLSVLVIRISFTEDAANSQRADRDAYAARLLILHEQLSLLEDALEALFEDVRAGRRRFVPYQSLKLYGSDATSRPAPRTAGTRRD
jgi:hypothetical protein